MIAKEIVILNKKGLRSRTVSQLVKKAMSFQSKIYIIYNGKKADAKSIINILALKVPYRGLVIISASGNDEVLAVDNLETLLSSLE